MVWIDGDGVYTGTNCLYAKEKRKEAIPGGQEWGRVCPAEWLPEALGLEGHLIWPLMCG